MFPLDDHSCERDSFFLTKAIELLLGGSEWFRPLRDPEVD